MLTSPAFSQTTIANFDFNGNTNATTAKNITASVTSTEANAAYAGTVNPSSQAFTVISSAGDALSMANSSGTNTRYWIVQLGGSELQEYKQHRIFFQTIRSAKGAQKITIGLSTDGIDYSNFTNVLVDTHWTEHVIDFTNANIDFQSNIYLKLMASEASGSGTLRIDNLQWQATKVANNTPKKNNYWLTSGNNITNNDFIGSINTQDVRIKSNNQLIASFEYENDDLTKHHRFRIIGPEDFPLLVADGTQRKVGFGKEPCSDNCFQDFNERIVSKGAVKILANTGIIDLDKKGIVLGHDGYNALLDLHSAASGQGPGSLLLGWHSGYDVALVPKPGLTNAAGGSNLYVHGKLGVGADAINSNYKLNVGGAINATEFYKNGVPVNFTQWINGNTYANDINYTNGNVGIGTTTEDSVFGNRNEQNINGNLTIKSKILLSGDNNNTAEIIFRNSINNGVTSPRYNGDVAIEMVDIESDPTYNNKPIRGLNFWLPWSNGAQSLHNYRLFVNSYENPDPNEKVKPGFIGVGTARPEAPLHLVSDNPSIILEDNLIEPGSTALGKCHLSASNGALRLISDADVAIFLDADNSQNDESFSIFANNEYAIEPATPLFKVNKEGVTSTKELVVDLNPSKWPDFVFNKNYPLLSIKETEKFIKQHNHLPGIPSVEELSANGGLKLGEMQRLQLQKIEELILYITELKKENKSIKEKLKKLNENLAIKNTYTKFVSIVI